LPGFVIVPASPTGCQCRAFPHQECYWQHAVPSDDNAPGRTHLPRAQVLGRDGVPRGNRGRCGPMTLSERRKYPVRPLRGCYARPQAPRSGREPWPAAPFGRASDTLRVRKQGRDGRPDAPFGDAP